MFQELTDRDDERPQVVQLGEGDLDQEQAKEIWKEEDGEKKGE